MKRKPAITVAAVALAAIAATIYYAFVFDPDSRFNLRCPIRALTGYDCPGCGTQRAIHSLLHGHVAEAWHYNAFIFFGAPATVFYIVVEAMRAKWPRLYCAAVNPWLVTIIFVFIIAWWIGRNL